MDKDINKNTNLIIEENNQRNNLARKYSSKTKYSNKINSSSKQFPNEDEGKKDNINTSLETIIFNESKENKMNILKRNECIENKYNSKLYNTTLDFENKRNKLKDEINNIDLNLDSTFIISQQKKETIKINKRKKDINNSRTQNHSFFSYKEKVRKRPLIIKSHKKQKNQSYIDNNYLDRKIFIHSVRNKEKIKITTNNNSLNYKKDSLNIYNSNKKNNKKIFSSLIKKSTTPKIKNLDSLNYENCNKTSILINQRYKSVKHSLNKNNNKNISSNDISKEKNKNKTYNKLEDNLNRVNENIRNNNNSFICCDIKRKNILSPKEQIIEDKIKELNEESKKFREERKKVNELRKEYEKLQSKLFKDIEDFSKKKEEFEKFKQNEINNINKERKNMYLDNKNVSNTRNHNKLLESEIKKNEEIIVQLRNQINELQSIIKDKDNEIKNLQKIINEKNLTKKLSSCNKIKEMDIGINNNNNLTNFNKKNNSVKILKNSEKNNSVKSKPQKSKKINIIKKEKNNISFCNTNIILGQKNSCRYLKDRKNKELYYSHIVNDDNNKTKNNISDLLNKSNQISKKSSLVFNTNLIKKINNNKNIHYKIEPNYNTNTNINYKTSISNIDPISLKFSCTNSNLIKNYQNKTNNSHNTNSVRNKLKKNPIKMKTDIINNKYINKNYLTNKNYYNKLEIEKLNEDNLVIKKKDENIDNMDNNIKDKETNTLNDNYDFIITERYLPFDENRNKIVNMPNTNKNNIAIYSNNKKEIIYPDDLNQIIYNDNHQIFYDKNEDKKKNIINRQNMNSKENKVETSCENGIRIVKYKIGKLENFLGDNKENINNNNSFKKDLNKINIKDEGNKELK